MPSIERPLSGDVLVFDLGGEREHAEDAALLKRGGRNARTLIKDGPLRVTLVAVAAGGTIAEHVAEGPITVLPVRGRIRFTVHGRHHDLEPGRMLAAGPGIRHSVSSDEGGAFLLTVALPGAAHEAGA
jgi:quercetin dioxygenase-like cupin family protein